MINISMKIVLSEEEERGRGRVVGQVPKPIKFPHMLVKISSLLLTNREHELTVHRVWGHILFKTEFDEISLLDLATGGLKTLKFYYNRGNTLVKMWRLQIAHDQISSTLSKRNVRNTRILGSLESLTWTSALFLVLHLLQV